MTTKNEEKKILSQIEKLIESAGKDSYIAYAFAGCCDIARDNIENDFANSLLSQRAKCELDLHETKERLDAANEEIGMLKRKMKERKPIPNDLYRELWLSIEAQESEAKNELLQAAELISYIEDTSETGTMSYINALKQARIRRDSAARLLAKLEKYEPKNI